MAGGAGLGVQQVVLRQRIVGARSQEQRSDSEPNRGTILAVTRLPKVDFDAGERAYLARDTAAFTAFAADLGVELDLDRLTTLVASRFNDDGLVRAVFEAIFEARVDPVGFAVTSPASRASWCLAVRVGDSITVGVTSRYSREDHPTFAEIPRWYGDRKRNRKSLERWAAATRPDDQSRLVLAISTNLESSAASPGLPDQTERALIQALRKDPDDLAARLVYADWLTAHDDVRGELIRLHCALESTSPCDPTWKELRSRARAVEPQYTRAIAGDTQSSGLALRKGLVRVLATNVAGLSRASTAIANHPIDELAIELDDRGLRRLAHVELPGLPRLHVFGSVGQTRYASHYRFLEIDALAAVTMPHVLALKISSVAATPEAWGRWLAQANMPALRSLHIDRCHVDPSLIGALAESAGLSSLETLTLSSCRRLSNTLVSGMPAAVARQLAAGSPRASWVEPISKLAASDLGAQMRELHVLAWQGRVDSAIMDDVVRALFSPESRLRLSALSLTSCDVGEGALAFIEGSPRARLLRRLDLSFTRVGARAMAAALRSGRLQALEELRFEQGDRAPFAEELASALLDLPASAPLRRVYWNRSGMDERLLAQLRARFELVRLHEGETVPFE